VEDAEGLVDAGIEDADSDPAHYIRPEPVALDDVVAGEDRVDVEGRLRAGRTNGRVREEQGSGDWRMPDGVAIDRQIHYLLKALHRKGGAACRVF
jgi:hypothetical protein